MHITGTDPGPDPQTDACTSGFPDTAGDIATVVNSVEGGEGMMRAREISARSNIMVDVYLCGNGGTTDQAVALINTIANKVPEGLNGAGWRGVLVRSGGARRRFGGGGVRKVLRFGCGITV